MNLIKSIFSNYNLCISNAPSNENNATFAILLAIAVVAIIIGIIIILIKIGNRKDKKNQSTQIEQSTQNGNIENGEVPLNNQSSVQPQSPTPQQAPATQAVTKSNHGFLKFLVAILIIGAIIFGAVKLIDCAKNPDNKDGATKPFSRSANNNDIHLEQSVEASILNLKDSYIVTPYSDIANLQITFTYYDSSGSVLSNKTKDLGSVVKNSSYTITVDHTLSEFFSISKYSYSVTGGTVSYIN